MSDVDHAEQLTSPGGASGSAPVPAATADAVDPLLGAVLDGRYLIERVVGSGGFGVVYRAVHLQFDSPVAIKVLRIADGIGDEERKAFIELFLAEGRLLFNLQALHSSIVRVFETGTLRGTGRRPAPYLVMEWLDGLSLDRELKHRCDRGIPLPDVAEVIALLAPCVEGLARAHRTRIAHRDIKPGNIFLARQGEQLTSKLLDFGLAKVAADSATTSAMLEQTGPGNCSFTPGYGAPEQWLSRLGTTGPWTDVYSLALVCVELLCGRRALLGVDRAQLMAACLDGALRPTPNALGAHVSDAVEAVFARALALEPRDRHRNADDFWRALCDAAQVRDPLPSVEWEAWARTRELERAGTVAPNGARATAVPDDWMQADTAPMATYAALPLSQPARRSLRRQLLAVAAGICVLLAATAARYLAREHATPLEQPAVRRMATVDREVRAALPLPLATAIPSVRVLATARVEASERTSASPDRAPTHSARGRARHARSAMGVAPILRGAQTPTDIPTPTAGSSPPPVQPPATTESLLKHDALSRRK